MVNSAERGLGEENALVMGQSRKFLSVGCESLTLLPSQGRIFGRPAGIEFPLGTRRYGVRQRIAPVFSYLLPRPNEEFEWL